MRMVFSVMLSIVKSFIGGMVALAGSMLPFPRLVVSIGNLRILCRAGTLFVADGDKCELTAAYPGTVGKINGLNSVIRIVED